MTPEERALILAKREGYARATMMRPDYRMIVNAEEHANQLAASAYPLPKVTRHREVVRLNGIRYRMVGGMFEVKPLDGEWRPSNWSVEDAGLLADLRANPTEEVEE